MRTTKLIIQSFFFFLTVSLFSQNMKEGFDYLENGEYAKAETYFKQVLIKYGNNKTAKLCYGRAIGLNGKPQEAKSIFKELLQESPSNFEFKLNYGESLLWNKEFSQAELYYSKLIQENNQSFPALLGYANTLSNLKKYKRAIVQVNKALAVSKNNPNALISKKYIYLGYAYQKQQNQEYTEAETLLKNNLNIFENDPDTLFNLANLYLIMKRYDDAETVYQTLTGASASRFKALNGLSLVAHLKGKNKKSLRISHMVYDQRLQTNDSGTRKQIIERYVQSLIWNRKYKNAQSIIDSLASNRKNENWILALRATLNIYKSNFKNSLRDYNQILKNDSTSFDGNLGKANVLKALGRNLEARKAAEKTLTFYKNQQDAMNFIETLDHERVPKIETKASHTFDNGNNEAYNITANLLYPLTNKWKIIGSYNFRDARNTVTNNSANFNSVSIGLDYLIAPKINVKFTSGFISTEAQDTDFTQLITDVSLSVNSLKLQNLSLGYQRQVESFNAQLLERELVQNNFYLNYNLNTNFNLGWYSQMIYTSQNDDNVRNLFFTSLYYSVFEKPILKLGVNYQNITFKNQVPAIYFSPKKFNAAEIFLNIVRDQNIAKPKQWFYNATFAFGYQFIENDARQNAYRVQSELGYKFSKKTTINLFGIHSNIASATAAGFKFTELGLNLKHSF